MSTKDLPGYFENLNSLSPSSLLTAGTTISSLRTSSRYANLSDKSLELVARDLKQEARVLEEALEKGRLEMWWKGVFDAAKLSVREEADRQGAEAAKRAETMKILAERMGLRRRESRVVNGDVNGVERDEQGDVVMG